MQPNDSLGILDGTAQPQELQQPEKGQGFKDSLGILGSTDTHSYGLRADGTPKGPGFFGSLNRPDGKVSTELSIGVSFNGKETEIPLLVPTLTTDETDHLLSGKKHTKAMVDKAVAHAKERMKQGKSPFAEKGEQSQQRQDYKDSLGILHDVKPVVPVEDIEQEISKRADILFQTQYAKDQLAMGRSKEDIQKDLGGLEAPWVDPVEAGVAAMTGGTYFAASRGASALPALGRGLAAALPAAIAEYPIGQVVDSISEENPELAFLAAVGIGLTSGFTVEHLAERGLLNLSRKMATRYPQQAKDILSPDVLKRLREGIADEGPEFTETQLARIQRKKEQSLKRPTEDKQPIKPPETTIETPKPKKVEQEAV